jgi:hypothetical protein
MAALFWLALQMFRVVLLAQLEARARVASNVREAIDPE